jgi:hypothetical protein
MAEFQFFAGIALDPSDVNKRRAFIDKDGKPVSPSKKKSESDPQSGSIELMKKKPEILLHGSSNWIHGNNTGSIGIDKDGKKLPSGQFKPTAKIVSYKPDPALHDDKKKVG